MSADDRPRVIATAAHPIVLGAGVVVVVNDYVLRAVSPGWLTGKLSDVGFLVVAPVFTATALAMLGMPARWARGVGLVGVAALYTVLQLWPPLGASVRADHVADAEDLLVLPALLGAVYAWRTARSRPVLGAVALPGLAGVLMATSYGFTPESSLPCGSDMAWDAAEPLYVQLPEFDVPVDTDAFRRGLRLTDEDGVEVALVTARGESGLALVCARDGLRGDTAYTWEIGPWSGESSNEVRLEHPALPTVRFRTLPEDGPPAPTAAACAALDHRVGIPSDCDDDTGAVDTGPVPDAW